MAEELRWDGKTQLNERYLHHWFSHRVQETFRGICFPISGGTSAVPLHPEWPTWKKDVISYRKYRKGFPCDGGTEGLVDFAVGDYQAPDLGVEFCLKPAWNPKEVIFDFVKMLDAKLPFDAVVCWVVVLRHNQLARGGRLCRLQEKMAAALKEAEDRLRGDVCGKSRTLWFVVSEISATHQRHWHLDRTQWRFLDNLPVRGGESAM
jgi:hypothetical protein